MSSNPLLSVSENEVIFPVRAKYIPDGNGGFRLAKIQRFSSPKFKKPFFEDTHQKNKIVSSDDVINEDDDIVYKGDENDILRAIRRAQNNAFDVILANPDMDTFATFTYSPDSVSDKSDYIECYNRLKVWLSNRVQRKNLKYVITPEYTKKGDIHFHAIMNSPALILEIARSAKNGRILKHNGKPLYNITDWQFGFTSAEIIGSSSIDRDKVAKYIFKYMGKQLGQKIGGRYCLIGGDVNRPIYRYGHTPEEFFEEDKNCTYDRHLDLDFCGITYDEWSYI